LPTSIPSRLPIRLWLVMGTRPEAIKLSPLVLAARARPDEFTVRVVVTGQHREMLKSVLAVFGIEMDVDLDIMQVNQTLSGIVSRVLDGLDTLLAEDLPDWLVVQGDTSTALAAALAAFHRGVRVAHVEAGLRTGDVKAPFPEELNRQLVTRLATLHFAPTQWAAANLQAEGVEASRVLVTGNTVIDALQWVRANKLPGLDLKHRFPGIPWDTRLVLITGHRRENFGKGMEEVCGALIELAQRYEDITLVYPVHLNPNVQAPVQRLLGPLQRQGRIVLLEPLDYLGFVALLDRCHIVITDSGGVQEEAPALGKPVLCTRYVTERPEGVQAGAVQLVGPDRDAIVAAVAALLDDPLVWAERAKVVSPYGDGFACDRILAALARSS
jgi:UDP-N-acetylglucosamine 2-epimerase (non-hydrolysing)